MMCCFAPLQDRQAEDRCHRIGQTVRRQAVLLRPTYYSINIFVLSHTPFRPSLATWIACGWLNCVRVSICYFLRIDRYQRAVTVIKLLCRGTVDEQMQAIGERKRVLGLALEGDAEDGGEDDTAQQSLGARPSAAVANSGSKVNFSVARMLSEALAAYEKEVVVLPRK